MQLQITCPMKFIHIQNSMHRNIVPILSVQWIRYIWANKGLGEWVWVQALYVCIYRMLRCFRKQRRHTILMFEFVPQQLFCCQNCYFSDHELEKNMSAHLHESKIIKYSSSQTWKQCQGANTNERDSGEFLYQQNALMRKHFFAQNGTLLTTDIIFYTLIVCHHGSAWHCGNSNLQITCYHCNYGPW